MFEIIIKLIQQYKVFKQFKAKRSQVQVQQQLLSAFLGSKKQFRLSIIVFGT